VIKEAIDRIAELAVGERKIQTVLPPGEPDHIYLLAKPDGSVEKCVADAPPRAEELGDVDSFAARVLQLTPVKESVIFVGSDNVYAVLDDEKTRRERLFLPLPPTPQFTALINAAGRELMPHGRFVDFLRIDLATAVPTDCIALFRSLKGTRSTEARATVQTGKESLGRDVYAEVAASGKPIPELIDVTIPVYDLPAFPAAKIQCAVICDLIEMKFGLRPLAGQVRNAEIEAQRIIQGQVREVLPGYSVVLGKPTSR
jgi:hypothetical protein